MRLTPFCYLLVVPLVALAASCISEAPGAHAEGQLAVAVAPLSLPGISYACYDLEVRNDLEEVVWARGERPTTRAQGDTGALCSDAYGAGAGGDISYVGPCDASEADGADGGVAVNTVTLWIDGLYGSDDADVGGWQDPCVAGCTLSRSCVADGDVAVDFDLTVARRAQQGFFDVGVTFDQVFCSAKVDCGSTLLHDATGARGTTAVVALACTSGLNGAATTLYARDLVVTCAGGERYDVSPLGQGNTGAQEPGLFQTAVYSGTEQLTGYDKCYWNVALGLDLAPGSDGDQLPASCRLEGWATATTTALAEHDGAFWTPAAASRPVIHVDVPLTGTDGTLACSSYALDAGAEVATTYTDLSSATGFWFTNAMACGAAPIAAAPGAPLAIGPSTPAVLAGEQLTFSAAGGIPPYIYTLVSGGGSLVGALYTAPATPGTAVVRVTDDTGASDDATVTIASPCTPGSQVFSHNGATPDVGTPQSFTLPAGCSRVTIDAEGGGGGAGLTGGVGGDGGRAAGTFDLPGGTELEVIVAGGGGGECGNNNLGRGGYGGVDNPQDSGYGHGGNAGGQCAAAGGGGASRIRLVSDGTILVVAAGGGGSGGWAQLGFRNGGHGGGTNGSDGGGATANKGKGATQSAPGAGGTGGSPGGFGRGGKGDYQYCGGGGAGYYGGGGGGDGSSTTNGGSAGGGGGGSSFVNTGFVGFVSGTALNVYRGGGSGATAGYGTANGEDGVVTISWE